MVRRPRKLRIGVVVPLSRLLSDCDTPAELADRSGFVPGETLRQQIAEAIHSNSRDQLLFTRLLTDDRGRLLDTTELGRYPSTRLAEAITIRAGTCRYPTCTVPADRCDLDHHEPVPKDTTSGTNMDPFCRRHHRGKNLMHYDGQPASPTAGARARHGKGLSTFAGDEGGESGRPHVRVQLAEPGTPASETTTASTGPCPTPNTTDASTNHYPPDEPRSRTLSGPAAT